MKITLLTFFSLINTFAFGQKLQILDQNTNQPVSFANVRTLDGKHGMTSDIDGYVKFDENYKSLIISHVNYKTQQFNAPFTEKIYLLPKQNDLLEIVVSSVNPAVRVIKEAVKNRELHNPKTLSSYTYYAYSRLYIDMEGGEEKLQKTLKNQHLFMSESRTKHDFLKPNREQETLLFHKTSGMENPLFASFLSSFQQFSFYDELIFLRLTNRTYLNPISKNSWKKYYFDLQDTLINDTDSTFVIAFEPRENTTFEGFKGFLHINSDGYAIENISVEPVSVGALISFKMQQRYERVEKQWFPKQENLEIFQQGITTKDVLIKYSFKTYLSDIQIDKNLKKSDFSNLNRIVKSKSYVGEDTFWNKYRSDSLSDKEINTYQFYQSMPVKRLKQVDKFMNAVEFLLSGYIPFRQFKIPINSLLRQNNYEGTRLGFGLRTGDNFSEKLAFEGYIGYGFKDKALKYGFLTNFRLKDARSFFQLSYKQDLIEPATIDDGYRNLNITDLRYRSFLTERMDSLQQIRLLFQTPISRKGRIQIGFSHELRNPTYHYQYVKNDAALGDSMYRNSAVNLGLRWAWGETFSQFNNTIYQSQKPRMILQIFAEKGIKDILNSDLNYTKLDINFQERFASRRFGTTSLSFTATKIWGDVPYSYLVNGLGGANKRTNNFATANLFQTMKLYEFTSDQQVSLIVKQNFGRFIPSKSIYFQPELVISQGVSYGNLQNPNTHKSIDIQTLDKGYFESGLTINKLLRIKYLDFMYITAGAGIFARYGAYALPNSADNLVFRYHIGFDF
jgi:Family of unknown function (DUF5686)